MRGVIGSKLAILPSRAGLLPDTSRFGHNRQRDWVRSHLRLPLFQGCQNSLITYVGRKPTKKYAHSCPLGLPNVWESGPTDGSITIVGEKYLQKSMWWYLRPAVHRYYT